MKWRPEGWHHLRGGQSEHSKPNCKCTVCVSFENGADTMLEVLRSRAFIRPTEANGRWVFIPDDTELLK